MSTTKIVLNRQSDLILDNAQITAPVGIVVADIDGLQSAITSIDTNISAETSREISNRISGDESLDAKVSANLSVETSERVAGDLSVAANLSSEVANREAAVEAEESRAFVAETSLQNNIVAEASLSVVRDESLEAAMEAAIFSCLFRRKGGGGKG